MHNSMIDDKKVSRLSRCFRGQSLHLTCPVGRLLPTALLSVSCVLFASTLQANTTPAEPVRETPQLTLHQNDADVAASAQSTQTANEAQTSTGIQDQYTADAILNKAERSRGSGLNGLVMEITLTNTKLDRDGEITKEESQVMRVSAKGSKSLVEFLSPRKLVGRKILMVGSNMWFIAKSVRKPVPISPRQRLLGQAANGDIASTDYASDYQPSLIDIRECEDSQQQTRQCYVLLLKANSDSAAYQTIEYWVTTDNFQGIRADFFATSGKLFKSAHFTYDNEITVDGERYPFVSELVLMDAIQHRQRTTLSYRALEATSLPERIFDLRRLSR